jgi:predicted TIM-barrel fold metal-dependent hydrolase
MTSSRAELWRGACDCHTHVVDDSSLYPMVAERQYTPAPAPYKALLQHMQRTGMGRVVIVQPSFYGTDNRCMIDSLNRLGGAGRGIAVVEDGADPSQLKLLHEAGVRGLRINVESAGVCDMEAVAAPLRYWAARISELGWHLQIYASYRTIAQLAPMLASLAVPVVLDHFAMVPAASHGDDPQRQAILALLASGNVYVKLSASYRVSQSDAVNSTVALAHVFLEANPQRVLWGSDWPHTNREPGKAAHDVSRYRDISSDSLTDSICKWLPTCELRQQVLVVNPALLYDFPHSG